MSSVEKKVADLRQELADTIREYCRSQVNVWKLVPWLALQADGRTGHNDSYARAFYNGYWLIRYEPNSLLVDLDTGELVSGYREEEIAKDHNIWTIDPESINATRIVEELIEKANKPHGSYCNADEKIAWREKVAKEHNVTEVYERQGPRVNSRFVWDA